MCRELWSSSAPENPIAALERPVKAPQHTLARFSLDTSVLPLVTETLPVAEHLRRALLSLCRVMLQQGDAGRLKHDVGALAPAFYGKDGDGQPRRGHRHAFFLPDDEDRDGRLDHVTVFAPMGFSPLELQALDRLRCLRRGDDEPLRLVRVGLGRPRDFRAPMLAEATSWVSATPFVVTRFPKTGGQKRDRPEDYATPLAFAGHVLAQELTRRPELPPVLSIELEEGIGVRRLRAIRFARRRGKRDDDGDRRAAAGFRVTFASAVPGPLCLGHSCHFGLGLFLPSESAARGPTC